MARLRGRGRLLRLSSGLIVVAAGVLVLAGCPGERTAPVAQDDVVSQVVEVRDIRVLIARGPGPVRFRVAGAYEVRDERDRLLHRGWKAGWVEVRADDVLTIGGSRIPSGWAKVVPVERARFDFSRLEDDRWSPGRSHAGRLTFLRRSDGRLLTVNSLDVDTYVAGVLTRELYPDFHREAYRAQAVAARTYAMFQMAQRASADYDVTATEASQVYGGLPEGRGAARAVEAVHHTRGIVSTWTSPEGERIFCTYYSSACGGITQDVSVVKSEPTIPPLAGGVHCDYCRIAKGEVYRWDPVRLAKRDVWSRVVSRNPGWAELGDLRSVQVIERTSYGRIGRVRLVGTNGRSREMRGEDFRLAVGSRRMRSTACKLHDEGQSILLTDGRGFGHGMGMCQWGTQGQALAGRSASQILKFYYPKSNLTRAY